VVGVIAANLMLDVLAFRWSVWVLALVALAVLPVSVWRGRPVGRRCVAFLAAACVLAASPVDLVFTLRRGPAIRLAEARYGPWCSSEACYGCMPPVYRARWALVLAL
jgi:hypothetical protein